MLDAMPIQKSSDLSLVVVTLLKGVIYQESEPALWNSLLRIQASVRDFVGVMGLDLLLDEAEGYAFIRSRPDQEDDQDEEALAIPRLVARYQLSFPVSLLLALLRRKLAEFDAAGGGTRLVMTLEEIVDMLHVFSPDTTNEAKTSDQIELNLKRIEELGFLRKVKAGTGRSGDVAYEVRRILKAFVDGQWLAEFDARLASYHAHLNGIAPRVGEDTDDVA